MFIVILNLIMAALNAWVWYKGGPHLSAFCSGVSLMCAVFYFMVVIRD